MFVVVVIDTWEVLPKKLPVFTTIERARAWLKKNNFFICNPDDGIYLRHLPGESEPRPLYATIFQSEVDMEA